MKSLEKRLIYHLKKYNENFEVTNQSYYHRHRRLMNYKRAIEEKLEGGINNESIKTSV